MLNPGFVREKAERLDAQYLRIKKAMESIGAPAYQADKDARKIFKLVKTLSIGVCKFNAMVKDHIMDLKPENLMQEIAITAEARKEAPEEFSELAINMMVAIADYIEMNKAKYEREKATGGTPTSLRREKRAEAQG